MYSHLLRLDHILCSKMPSNQDNQSLQTIKFHNLLHLYMTTPDRSQPQRSTSTLSRSKILSSSLSTVTIAITQQLLFRNLKMPWLAGVTSPGSGFDFMLCKHTLHELDGGDHGHSRMIQMKILTQQQSPFLRSLRSMVRKDWNAHGRG